MYTIIIILLLKLVMNNNMYMIYWTADCFISTVRSPKTEKCNNVCIYIYFSNVIA